MPRIVLQGFVSQRSAHAHLLKHVLRVTEQQADAAQDRERWEQLIPEPPLVADVERRRAAVLAVLSRVPGCPVGKEGVTEGRPCNRCQDDRARNVISHEMASISAPYLAAAQGALDAAFANPDRHGPRLVAYRSGAGRTVETVDARHVRLVAELGEDGAHARVITCFRDRERSLPSWWLEHARLRAAHRRAGTLESIG
jgi:hypothetical protein